MTSLTSFRVQPCDTAEDLAAFLDFPRHLYASDPCWMPDPHESRLLLAPPSQWPATRCERKWFIAVAERPARDRDEPQDAAETIVGRVAAIVNPDLVDEAGAPLGQLGYFEAIPDLEVVRTLIDAAKAWIAQRRPSVTRIVAPMNFDAWHSYRWRLREPADPRPPFAGEPYNKPYYPDLLADLGFEVADRHVSKTVVDPEALASLWSRQHDGAIERGFRFRSFDPQAAERDVQQAFHLANVIFRDLRHFSPLPPTEFAALYSRVADGNPDDLVFAFAPGGSPAGLAYSFALPQDPQTVVFKTFGVMPSFRRTGLPAALAGEVYRRRLAAGARTFIHALMAEANPSTSFDRGLGTVTQEYVLFGSRL